MPPGDPPGDPPGHQVIPMALNGDGVGVPPSTPLLHWRVAWSLVGWGLIGLIIALSLAAPPATPSPISINDKLLHVLAYGALMGWHVQYIPKQRWLGYAIAFMLLGITLEYMQGASGLRTFDVGDMAANCVGVVVGWSLSAFVARGWLAWIDVRLGGRVQAE